MTQTIRNKIDRRDFLKVSALGLTGAVLAAQTGMAQADEANVRDLVLVSSLGYTDNENAANTIPPSLSLIDPQTSSVLKTLPLTSGFVFPASRWDFARDIIWSGLPAGPEDSVEAFKLSTGERVAHIPTGSAENYTELTPDGAFLIVAARYSDRFFKISANPDAPDFGKIVAEIQHYQGANPCDISISPDGLYAYAPDRGGDALTTLHLDRFEIGSSILMDTTGNVPLEPYMTTVSPQGNMLFVENPLVENGPDGGSESIFDLSNPENPVEIARFSQDKGLGYGPISSEFTPDGRYGLVICRDSSNLSVIDTNLMLITHDIAFPEGSQPLTGTFTQSGDAFFVPLPGRDAVAVVSVPDFKIVSLIPVGPLPLGVVYLQTSVPDRPSVKTPTGTALATARQFDDDCPHRCCGVV